MISKILLYDRLTLIERYLDFADNNSLGDDYKKTEKIQPIHDYLSKKFSEMYIPERDISIDKSLLLLKGRLSWKQNLLYFAKLRPGMFAKVFCIREEN